METQAKERRRRRSNDPSEALHHQLAQVRDEACLDALVLADGSGLIVAHAGDGELCNELAALAPLMGENRPIPLNQSLPAAYMQVRAILYQGVPLYLASSTDSFADALTARLETWLDHAHEGVARILKAAA